MLFLERADDCFQMPSEEGRDERSHRYSGTELVVTEWRLCTGDDEGIAPTSSGLENELGQYLGGFEIIANNNRNRGFTHLDRYISRTINGIQ